MLMAAGKDWVEVRRGGLQGLMCRARWCASFICRLRGVMFRRRLESKEALLLVESKASRPAAAIHMWAVFFPLGVIWLDENRRIVDKIVAMPWRLYVPTLPAKYILECEPHLVAEVQLGEVLEFAHAAPE
jgi:uncharacterized membrane protein (UPF0127 family)